MKKKNVLFGFVACLGVVALIFPMFLSLWTINTKLVDLSYSIFTLDAAESYGWFLTVEITAIVALVLAFLYVVVFALQLAKVGKCNYSKVRLFISYIMSILFVVALVCGIVGIIVNKYVVGDTVMSSTSFAIGYYFILGGTLLVSLFGILAGKLKKSKK